jgi:hypothetical protein
VPLTRCSPERSGSFVFAQGMEPKPDPIARICDAISPEIFDIAPWNSKKARPFVGCRSDIHH